MAERWTLKICDGAEIPQFMITNETELIALISIESGEIEDAQRFYKAFITGDLDIEVDTADIKTKFQELGQKRLKSEFEDACNDNPAMIGKYLKLANYDLNEALRLVKEAKSDHAKKNNRAKKSKIQNLNSES